MENSTIQIDFYEIIGRTLPLLISVTIGGVISAVVSYRMFKLTLKNDRLKVEEERLLNQEQMKVDLSINWYFKVLLLPNTILIETFFNDSKLHLQKSLSTIKESNGELKVKEVNSLNAEHIKEFKILLTTFEFNFLLLLRSNEISRDEKLLSWQNNLNDFYRKCLVDSSRSENSTIKIEEALKELSKFKVALYSELYKPLKRSYK